MVNYLGAILRKFPQPKSSNRHPYFQLEPLETRHVLHRHGPVCRTVPCTYLPGLKIFPLTTGVCWSRIETDSNWPITRQQ